MFKRSTIIPTLALVVFLVSCTHRQALTTPETGNSNDPIPTTEEEVASAELATPEPAVDEALDMSAADTQELVNSVEEPEFSPAQMMEPEAAPVVKKKSKAKKWKASKVKTAKTKSAKPRMKRKVAPARDNDVAVAHATVNGGDDLGGGGSGLAGNEGYQAGAEAVEQTTTTAEATTLDGANLNREPASVAPPIPDPTLTPAEPPLAVEAGAGSGWPLWATLLVMGGLVVAAWGIFRSRSKSNEFSYRP